jgi:hypothetical protein
VGVLGRTGDGYIEGEGRIECAEIDGVEKLRVFTVKWGMSCRPLSEIERGGDTRIDSRCICFLYNEDPQ